MLIHVGHCCFNYGATEETFLVKEVIDVFGKAARKLYLVQWEGHPARRRLVGYRTLTLRRWMCGIDKSILEQVRKKPGA